MTLTKKFRRAAIRQRNQRNIRKGPLTPRQLLRMLLSRMRMT